MKKLVEETQSKIVLVSTKKDYWKKKDKNKQGLYGAYLDEKFSEYGLSIYDKTIDDGIRRGIGVLAWKTTNKINNLVILDDDASGYDALTSSFYLVKILSKNGLTEQDIEKAKFILSKK